MSNQTSNSPTDPNPLTTPFVTVTTLHRNFECYQVTEIEINMYAQLGWLSTIFLTLSGIFAGLAGGAYIALKQQGLLENSIATLETTKSITFVVAILFFLSAIVFLYLQSRSKKQWEKI